MPVLQVYFPTKEEIDKVKKEAKDSEFKSVAEYIRSRLKGEK